MGGYCLKLSYFVPNNSVCQSGSKVALFRRPFDIQHCADRVSLDVEFVLNWEVAKRAVTKTQQMVRGTRQDQAETKSIRRHLQVYKQSY